MISLISAIGKNNEIGRKNTLLWEMPADMKHFRDTTRGKTIVMGEKTFESIGRQLPNRRNIVLTLDKTYLRHGVDVFYSLPELLEELKGEEEVFIIGGGQIYRLFIKIADKLYITHVNEAFPDADTFFPEIDPAVFKETKRESYTKDEQNPYDYDFVEYERY